MFNAALCYFCKSIYIHLSQVLNSLLVFQTGYSIARRIKKGNYSQQKTIIFIIALFLVKLVPSLKGLLWLSGISSFYVGVLIALLAAYVFDKIACNWLRCGFRALGEISLEMYLCNIFLLDMLNVFSITDKIQNTGSVFNEGLLYALVIVTGLFLSKIYRCAAIFISSRANQRCINEQHN